MNANWQNAISGLREGLLTSDLSPASIVRAGLLIFVGIPFARMASRWARNRFNALIGTHYAALCGSGLFYFLGAMLFVAALQQLGFRLAPFFGAAGVLGVAVGFASQTSLSNVISGLFLVVEKPFEIGDAIEVNAMTGIVDAIGMLSVTLRTYDNKLIRIPNEMILKGTLVNLTRFPTRRMDLKIPVAYREDIARVRTVLMEIVQANALCLSEPQPLFIIHGFGDSSVDLQFSVWAARENFLAAKNSMWESIKKRFDSEGIEIPFPHLSLYAGSASPPLPVSLQKK